MCQGHALETYPPLNTLKLVAENIWIVDGPTILFGMPLLKIKFPTRMTIVRLKDGSLFLHSPTPITPALKQEIEALGQPKWIIAPNRIHYWWVPEWKHAFPNAEVYLAPKIKEQAKDRITFNAIELSADTGYPWDQEILTIGAAGSFMTEFDFFHTASRTLILTDLIENFERDKLGSWFLRWLTRIAGIQDPNGQMPKDMRLSFSKNKAGLKATVKTMIGWQPEQVILAHGRWYETNGTKELERAFRWLLF